MTTLVVDPGAAARMAEVFQADLDRSTEIHQQRLEERPWLHRRATRAALLLALVL